MDADGWRTEQESAAHSQLDYNDNSRLSTKNSLEEIHGKTEELSSISAFTMDLPPLPVAGGHSSNLPDKGQQIPPDLPALMSGLDDTLNNDFFYDDEFTVPFDANLTEDCQSLPPGVDSLLRRLLPGNAAADDDDNDWRRSRMALSKSDSCLYQADQELSDSEREMSMSEHDEYSSSSNNSPLQNQSLFSSCGEPPAAEICVVEGKCNGVDDEITESVLSGSLTRGDLSSSARYSYDWTLNKQQYVLMFDRSPTKTCSSEEDSSSCHQAADDRTRITSWSRAKSGRQKRRVEEQTGSGGSPTRRAEREKGKRSDSCFTTWGQLKSQGGGATSSSGAGGGGLTTWQQVKQTQMEELSTPSLDRATISFVSKAYPSTVKLSPVDETGSGTLVNIYCKMKTQEEMGGEFENNEAMASPLSLEKLLDTWTESLELIGLERTVDVVYNRSRTDLIPVATSRGASKKGPGGGGTGDYASKRRSDDPVLTGLRLRYGDDTPTGGEYRDTNPKNSTTTAAQQAGSPVLTSSLLRGHDTVDCSIQFPPASIDCAVQTSFTFSDSQQLSLMESKAQQTSVIAVAAVPNPKDNSSAGYSSSTTLENKMVLSLNRPLPDLSFLKKNSAHPGLRKYDDVEIISTSRAHSEPPPPRHSTGKQQPAVDEEEASHAYGKPLFQQCRRPPAAAAAADVKASSSSDSRDSSPRPVVYRNRSRSSDSASTYSVCSTSSSGIDPGFYDSSGSGTRTPRMSRIFDDGTRTPVALDQNQKTPPKPPRLYAASSESHIPVQFVDDSNAGLLREAAVKSGSWSETVVCGRVCTACHSRIPPSEIGGAKALVSSHPVYFHEGPTGETTNSFKLLEYLQVSPTHSRTRRPTPEDPETVPILPRKSIQDTHQHQPGLFRHSSPRLQRSKEHVTLRGGSQQQGAKPAKSILVRRRQRNQAKHRSWSNPACDMEDLGPRHHGYLPSYLLGADRRPVSLPDENLLHQTQSGSVMEEEDGGCGGGSVGSSLSQLNAPQPPQRWKSQNCLSGVEVAEAGETVKTTIPADIVEEPEVAQENEEEEEDCDYERFKAKKSVSFSEKIFYHSTSATASPLDSPKCPQVALLEANPENTSAAIKMSVECKTLIDESTFRPDADDAEMPPTDFIVSPNLSPSSSLTSSDVTLSTDILHKRELVFDVMRAVEVLVKYFSQTRDPSKKVQLGSTMEKSEIGHLVLEHLCPAIHAVVLDGLKPYVNSLFGKVKNSACKVMEDSAELGQPIELIQGLVKSLKSLKFLNTPWLLFNAFIFGLLNYKALDFWLTYIHNHKSLLARHYTSSSFIHLSNSGAHRLFLDMITSLQPLAQMPFRLEYIFETRMLERRQQDQLAEYLLDRHVSRSVETYIEGQQFLTQLENLSSSQMALQQDEMLSAAAASESKLKLRTKELWQKTQRHLVEKLSASRERLASESSTLIRSVTRAAANEGSTIVRNVTRAAATRKPRPMSLPGTFQVDDLRYVNPPACVSYVRSLAPLESMELLGVSDASCLVESSSGSESDPGFFLRLTKQLRDMHLRDRVYRRGATNYSFEDLVQKTGVVEKSETNDGEKLTMKDDNSACRSDVSELHPPANFKSDETAANSTSQCTDVQPRSSNIEKARLRNAIPSHDASSNLTTSPIRQQNSSDTTVGAALGARAVNLANGQASSSARDAPLPSSLTGPTLDESVTKKKRWSDFGSRLVNIFDRLLLSDTTATTGTGSSSSSSVVKCQSMGQIDDGGGVDRRSGGSKRRPLSTSTQFVKANSFDSTPGNQMKTARNPRSARALCHYIAADSQQLSFEKGNSLVVLQDRDVDWLLCRLGDSEGLVHSACLRMDEIPQRITTQ